MAFQIPDRFNAATFFVDRHVEERRESGVQREKHFRSWLNLTGLPV